MAVSVDAVMTTGSEPGGQNCYFNSNGSFGGTGITVGAGATCLLVLVSWDIAAISAVTVSWNGTNMTVGPNNFSTGAPVVAIFYLANPAAGLNMISGSWSGGATEGYYSAISFKGTNIVNPIYVPDSVTSTTSTITINSGTNDATVAIEMDTGTSLATPNFTVIFTDDSEIPNGAANYQLGGTSNIHNFAGVNGSIACAGVHVLAASSASNKTLLTLGCGQ
jgi:hypothetical protein